ncbi:MAG TPA: hypothetical protein VFV52_06525 [Bacilli bacterium]|nr:hypothetical protein [Bacilli bacterium]
MSAHHAPDWVPHREGHGIKNDGVLATWLGLISFTFFIGTFIAANVYLRMWSPNNFTVDFAQNADLPAITTIVLIVAGFITVIAGSFHRQGAWKKFQVMMGLAALAFIAYAVLLLKLMGYTHSLGAAAWTTHMGIYVFQFGLVLVNLFMIAKIGILFSDRNQKSLNNWVPAAMSVFLYTVILGIIVLLVTDMISVGEFTEWCGKRIGVLEK